MRVGEDGGGEWGEAAAPSWPSKFGEVVFFLEALQLRPTERVSNTAAVLPSGTLVHMEAEETGKETLPPTNPSGTSP